MSKCLDIVGKVFGHVTVKEYLGFIPNKNTGRLYNTYLCRCGCGKEWEVVRQSFIGKKRKIKSCGCNNLRHEIGLRSKTHGLSKHRIHRLWSSMRSRCYNKNNLKYPRYGGRGIIVCERWNEFINFYNDMGACPEGYSLDRIDVNGNYEPANCRWVDQKTQQNNRGNNRKLTFNGETKNVTEWGKLTGIPSKIIRQRIDRDGMTTEEALTRKTKDV